ncbi:PREDICTED: phosphoinositide phosphatase SAC2-like isoform X2 [Tarenaya hassleriana]|uniref:phosphoinositide phosphatase SAC2-like isoform X2 n=1 Tax=Tarenaya hassleriana TaxID=28532 RepID=UPI00053C163B|nr:PREDICTED: phosphoinositide phosphatase SAC2-like isoform X2 [Tarenaya hassleriana]
MSFRDQILSRFFCFCCFSFGDNPEIRILSFSYIFSQFAYLSFFLYILLLLRLYKEVHPFCYVSRLTFCAARYKKLLCSVDLTKDFFFSYSYHIMHNLQRKLCNNVKLRAYYDSMFVWNEYLTRGIRSILKDCLWTVALVYGFFKKVKLSIAEKSFKLTLIARRSRHYAGTRYLKRGVNEKGRVANDVETEQIIFEDVPDGCPVRISSVAQNRGSIPLFWSQETSRLNLKPDIILSQKDPNFEATRLHFENLAKRYGNPIIILNLIKTREKRPRETILRAEFANAIRFINKGLSKEERLRPLHWDLHKHSRNKATNVLGILGKLTAYAMNLTGIFYCQLSSDLRAEGMQNPSGLEKSNGECSTNDLPGKAETASKLAMENGNDDSATKEDHQVKTTMFQKGVLRTNCIDCLDRTNVAQYAYGLVALGRQLHALGFTETTDIDLENPLAEDLMGLYETMGDTLALQYGGSAAHNKIFCERRGQWKAATQSQEFFRTLQRYYSNAYMDAEKQYAINMFLGYLQPQPGKPALWELGSDQHYNVARIGANAIAEIVRYSMKRSLSEGNILCESDISAFGKVIGNGESLPENDQETKGLSESTPDITTCVTTESGEDVAACVPRQPCKDAEPNYILENDCFCFDGHGEQCACAAFDMDWVSSSGNSCEDESYGRSIALRSSENVPEDIYIESATSASESGASSKGGGANESKGEALGGIHERFVRWVLHGDGHFW